MSQRVEQMNLALERWRWLPEPYDKPRVLENLAEYTLRTYEADGTPALKMRTVNGQFAGGHETPVFTRMMRLVVFRPYWNVPPSIIKKELVGHIEKSGVGYLAAKNFEVTAGNQPVSDYSAADIEHLKYGVREKPGPTNSLGLVKFLFPNEYDVYMHSTNEPQLFNLTRRDRSHGCVRLQHPDDMAVWVLKGNDGDWDEDKVTAAMNDETANNKTVTLKTPLPVVVFYLTAVADGDGSMHFLDDVYKYDAAMEQLLEKGMPYPSAPVKINPKLTPGETV
jgi:murein L,D-transpeptidase YcbB/YkuD